MQFQSVILQVPVIRSDNLESTAKGAAMLAGLKAGLFDMDALKLMREESFVFKPKMKMSESENLYQGWKKALKLML